MTNKLTKVLFTIYLVALCWIIVFKMNLSIGDMNRMRGINLVPFSKPVILNGKVDHGENILNVLIFIPFGVYAGLLYKEWGIGKKIRQFFLVSLAFEICQYMLAVGVSDVTDIITNTFGGVTGLLIFIGIEKLFKTPVKAQHFINIIALTGTVLVLLFFLLLKTGNLWLFGKNIRYQ